MGEFIRRLGKKVQSLLNKIFGKKEKPQNETKWNSFTTCDFSTLGRPGEIYIDGRFIGKVKENVSISKDDIPDDTWESLKSIFGDGEIAGGCVNLPPVMEPEKKIFNIPLSFLPKRYWCKTLILSLAANQESDYQAVDMSQYEERSLAHYIIGRKGDWDNITSEYAEYQEEDYEEEKAWAEELVRESAETGLFSTVINNVWLLHYEELGVWDYEEMEPHTEVENDSD